MKVLTQTGLTKLIQLIKSSFLSNDDVEQITTLDIDSTPTTGSTNLVTSGGVKSALDGKSATGHSHTKSQITDFPTFAAVATSGSYADLSNKPTILSLGETSTTAYRGDRGKTAYDHSQTAHAPSTAEANVQSDWTETNTSSDAYIKNKPSTFPPSTHNHDDRYYTENEVDTALSGKANTSHTHTKSEITDFPSLLTLGETSTTAYRGDRGKIAYDHSQTAHFSGNYDALTSKPQINGVELNGNKTSDMLGIIAESHLISGNTGSVTIGDILIQWGKETWTSSGSGAHTRDITFPEEFGGTPTVMLTIYGSGTGAVRYASVGVGNNSESATGFTLADYTSASSLAINVMWFAIGIRKETE